MPELRKDPVSGRWVIIARDRAGRPNEFPPLPRRRSEAACPFCEGNEAQTPAEVLAVRPGGSPKDGPGWQVRVVPNKYPALVPGPMVAGGPQDLFTAIDGVGVHEVVIETPHHRRTTAELDRETLLNVLRVYRDRLLQLCGDRRLMHATIFKNVGAAAGASIEHAHSQIVATPLVPSCVREEMTAAREYFAGQQSCIFCEMLKAELDEGRRVVVETESLVAFCPFASRFAYETWIIPKRHANHFQAAEETILGELADVLLQVVTALESILEPAAYNYLIHTAPFERGGTATPGEMPKVDAVRGARLRRQRGGIDEASLTTATAIKYYHWHVEVLPRVAHLAGFEWGTGFFINAVGPEEAARQLRKVLSELIIRRPDGDFAGRA